MISVKEASVKFGISSRRVQKLCEEGRITGAQMISNVWLIPDTAEKPQDSRKIHTSSDLLTLSELCEQLSISIATGRNWVKLGKVTPATTINKTPCFTRDYVTELKSSLQEGSNLALKSRRNKKFVRGNNIYNSYVSDTSKNIAVIEQILKRIECNEIPITQNLICCLIADCAIQLIGGFTDQESFPMSTNDFIAQRKELANVNCLFMCANDILENVADPEKIVNRYPFLFSSKYIFEYGEDILGLLYISLRNIGNRKATGAYYTPTKIVKKLCTNVFANKQEYNLDILDPCCGTGNFILQLPDEVDPQKVFGYDIDELSIKIARINFALKFNIHDYTLITKHIVNGDYLKTEKKPLYDIILGNPPWGYDFSEEDKHRLKNKYLCATGANVESYDVFIEQGISNLRLNGVLSFVLPEAVLNVKTHTSIREIIFKETSIRYVAYLGNAFHKVQCPCIILNLINNKPFNCNGMLVEKIGNTFSIMNDRHITPECFSFLMTDEEYQVMEKIQRLNNAVFLKNNSLFALGIVTGNNKKYIDCKRNADNEVILKGSDIYKYRIVPSENYIIFKPESFQQVAPTELYRASEKLLYRFICNQLVFAYDNRQTLSLNSCNILIPELDKLDIKYVLAILNSRVAQFFFKNMFNSVKVLRSHIEAIPIPEIDGSEQQKYISLCDEISLQSDASKIQHLYDALDKQISGLYGLSEKEQSVILNSMNGENLFLM